MKAITSQEELKSAIETVVNYNWNSELRDFEEHQGDGLVHIFPTLVALSNWIYGTTYTPEGWIRIVNKQIREDARGPVDKATRRPRANHPRQRRRDNVRHVDKKADAARNA